MPRPNLRRYGRGPLLPRETLAASLTSIPELMTRDLENESMELRWRIELLGGLRATRGDRVVTRFQRQKAGALLAYLAYFRQRPHPRPVLIELLWPECDPE